MPPSTVYTAGYHGKSPDVLYRGAVNLEAIVLDVRYNGWSRMPEWDHRCLQELMGGYYRRMNEWGNENYHDRRKPIKINDFQAGLGKFLPMTGPVILLCYCPQYHKCHRADLSRMIEPILGFKTQIFRWEEYETAEPALF